MTDEDPADRVEAVLADARGAVEDATDDGEVAATPTLRAVSNAAAGLVDEADSADLLAAVGLDDEDYDSVPEAIGQGEPERVRELEQLLKLSRLADAWDDSEGDQIRSELPELFDVTTGEGASAGGEASDDQESEAAEAADDSEESEESVVESVVERVTDDESEGSDEDGIVVRAVESIAEDDEAEDTEDDGAVASAVERVAEAAADSDGSGDDEESVVESVVERATDDREEAAESSEESDGADSDEGETRDDGVVESVVERVTDDGSERSDEDEGIVESALRSQLEDAVGQFREGIERAQADLDALRAVGDDGDGEGEKEEEADRTSDGNQGSGTRHSTIPDSDARATRHSTIPDSDARATRHSTVPDGETSDR